MGVQTQMAQVAVLHKEAPLAMWTLVRSGGRGGGGDWVMGGWGEWGMDG